MQKNITRVEAHTSGSVNDKIRQQTDARIARLSKHPAQIPDRLRALDREWDIERALETGSSTLSLTGLFLGLFHHRRWLFLPIAVQAFFLQHALQGWCPPLPIFRRMGIRTMREILYERHALESLVATGARAKRTPHRSQGPNRIKSYN